MNGFMFLAVVVTVTALGGLALARFSRAVPQHVETLLCLAAVAIAATWGAWLVDWMAQR